MRKKRLWWRLFISYLWVPAVVLLSIGWYASDVVWELYKNHLDGVHGDNYAITDRAVDVQIVGLRRKLGSAGSSIETVRGVGYRFKE